MTTWTQGPYLSAIPIQYLLPILGTDYRDGDIKLYTQGIIAIADIYQP